MSYDGESGKSRLRRFEPEKFKSALGSRVMKQTKAAALLPQPDLSLARAAAIAPSNAGGSAFVRAEIAEISRRDYGFALRRCLSRNEVLNIVYEGTKRVWPGLNRDAVRLVSTDEFVRRWSGLGVDFSFLLLEKGEGLGLLGFYMNNSSGLRDKPLICVNIAHHPALVGVALGHEMGHHLTSDIFGQGPQSAHLLSQAGYGAHLSNQFELAADTLVSLGVYPKSVARNLFENLGERRGGELAGLPSARVLDYIAHRYGVNLDFASEGVAGPHFDGKRRPRVETRKKLHAMAALIHYTKLRRALLEEYGV
jgi:hypothetical protein